jgi:hypothetical protein
VAEARTTILYALSTLAQTCAALAAFVGAVGIYRLQLLLTSHERTADAIKGIMAHRISRERSTDQIVDAANRGLAGDPNFAVDEGQHERLRRSLAKWAGFNRRYRGSRSWLIGFEAWNLLVILASLVGFNHVPALAVCPWTLWALWPVALVTAGVTGYCVFIWTRD